MINNSSFEAWVEAFDVNSELFDPWVVFSAPCVIGNRLRLELQVIEGDRLVLLVVELAEVHEVGAYHIPAVGRSLQDNSRLLGAHIDYVQALRVFEHHVGERLVVVVREGLQTAVFRILWDVRDRQFSLFSTLDAVDKSYIFGVVHHYYELFGIVFEDTFDCLFFEIFLFMIKLELEIRVAISRSLNLLDFDKE